MATVDVTNPAREVLNQAPPLQPVNLFEVDLALREALEREGGGWGVDRAREAGAVAGSVEALEHCRRAERNVPILRTHDRYGNRIDEVELDPSWHALLRGAVEREIHSLPWRTSPAPGAHVVRAALFMLWGNANAGVMCPVSMTYAAVPALRDGAPELAAEWEPRLTAPDYDAGALAGMAMTEKPGRLGRPRQHHPRRAGRRRPVRAPRPQVVLLVSAVRRVPGARAGARRPVVLPRRARPRDGVPAAQGQARDAVAAVLRGRVPRRRTAASSARRAAACPRSSGWSTTRGSTACSAAPPACGGARSRRSTTPATARRSGRCSSISRRCSNVLADLAIESEAATAAALRVARAYDEPDEGGVPAVRHRGHEVLGVQARRAARGRGARVPRRQRVRRGLGPAAAVSRRPAELDLGGLGQRRRARRPARDGQGARRAAGVPGRVRARGRRRRAARRAPRAGARRCAPRCSPSRASAQFGARRIVEDLAVALQGSLLVRHAPPAVADAFCAARLAATAVACTGRSRRASTPARSSTARCRRDARSRAWRRASGCWRPRAS